MPYETLTPVGTAPSGTEKTEFASRTLAGAQVPEVVLVHPNGAGAVRDGVILTGDEQAVLVQIATPNTPISPALSVPDWANRALIDITPGSNLNLMTGYIRARLNGNPGGAVTTTVSNGVAIPFNSAPELTFKEGTSRTLGLSATHACDIRVTWLA